MKNVRYIVYHNRPPEHFQIIDIESKKVFEGSRFDRFYSFINTSNTIYVYEPSTTKDIPPSTIQIPSLCLVSPNVKRIAQYRKRENTTTLYMPMWELDEARIANQLLGKVEDDELVRRFEQVGGVIRPLLGTEDAYRTYLSRQRNYINAYQSLQIFKTSDPFSITQGHEVNTSHFLLHYLITSRYFRTCIPRIATAFVAEMLKRLRSDRNYEECVEAIKNGKRLANIGALFEFAVVEAVTHGKKMTTHHYGPSNPENRETEAKDRDSRIKDLRKAEVVTNYIKAPLENMLIYPNIDNFPAVDFYALIDLISFLALIVQCKSGYQTKPLSLRALWKLTHKYISVFNNFHYILFAIDAEMAGKWNKVVNTLWDESCWLKEAEDIVKSCKKDEDLLALCFEFDIPTVVPIDREMLTSSIQSRFKEMMGKITYSIRTLNDLDSTKRSRASTTKNLAKMTK